jgi:hypothetical protein
MIKRIAFIALTLAIAPLGCIIDETTHVVYLEPDGSVTWRVLQDLVRSDKEAPRERLSEEERFVDGVDTADDSWSKTFAEMGATEVDAWYLRDRRPYSLVVEARFEGLDEVTEALAEQTEAEMQVSLVQDGDLFHYTLTVPPPAEAEDADDVEDAWQWAQHRFRLVTARGRFVQARGFAISADGAVAVPRRLTEEEVQEYEGASFYTLTWDTGA